LGAALLEACLRQGWLRPQDGSRALQVSSKGRAGLRGLAERTAG
ncbi:transcriptional regulator, partial [Pseudomonas aeruginosa]|nr:transcriptional regulator [Pseudomonas aeruginosa]